MQTNFDIPFKNIVEVGQQTMFDQKLFYVIWILNFYQRDLKRVSFLCQFDGHRLRYCFNLVKCLTHGFETVILIIVVRNVVLPMGETG